MIIQRPPPGTCSRNVLLQRAYHNGGLLPHRFLNFDDSGWGQQGWFGSTCGGGGNMRTGGYQD